MIRKFQLVIALLGGVIVLSGCAPLIGAGAVVATDKIVEHENGGEGLF